MSLNVLAFTYLMGWKKTNTEKAVELKIYCSRSNFQTSDLSHVRLIVGPAQKSTTSVTSSSSASDPSGYLMQ
jgi:hypothetical protein